MKPTMEQDEITEHSVSMAPGDFLKVIAFAGAGKTTTLKGVAKARRDRGGYLVFNAANAEEAKRKLALTKCTATTMHALAYGAVRESIGRPASLNARVVRESGVMERFRIPRVEGWNDYRVAAAVIRTMGAFCNSADQEFLVSHAAEALISSVGDPDFIRDGKKRDIARNTIDKLGGVLSQMAEAFFHKCMEDNLYSHDMYLKAIDLSPDLRNSAFGMFRYLMVDEAQDINPVQRSIIMKTGLPIIAVGDPFQQIYSWRGAENALALMPGRELYLTQSFRFGEKIAEVARHILSVRPDGGPEQRLIGAGRDDITGHTGSKLAIICRTNGGMLDEALNLMKRGRSLHVDNMAGLKRDVLSAQALFDGRLRDIQSPELKHFETWDELKIEADEGDNTLARLAGIVEENMVPMIEQLADHQQSDASKAEISICTAHRSKGMEWPAVALGGDWKNVVQMSKRHQKAQTLSEKHKTLAMEEFNALYVAATRPILRLARHEKILFPEPELDLDQVPAGYTPQDMSTERTGRTAPAAVSEPMQNLEPERWG